MAITCRLPARPAFAFSSRHSRKAVVVRAQNKPAKSPAGVTLMAAVAMVLSAGPALCPLELPLLQPAHAEDVSEEALTPYQRRQRELERRREILRQTREQAEGRAGSEVAAPSTAEADAAVEAANEERRAAASQLAAELKSSAAAAYENSTSRYRGFGGFSSAPPPAAEPEPAKPSPSPFFRQETKPEPAVQAPAKKVAEQPKAAPAPAGKQKRRGPLPLFLAEVLVLGSFVGVGLAATKYSEQTSRALALAGEKGKELYTAAEEALAKAQQK